MLDRACLSDASESAGDTEEPSGEGGMRGRAHPLPENEGKKSRKQREKRAGTIQGRGGELGSTPHVSLKLGSCYFPKKPICPTPACPSEEVPTVSLRQVSASAVWPRGGLGTIWL